MILEPTDHRSAAQIWDLLMAGAQGFTFDDCPWVRIGNLYMSVTFTGDNSWAAIARANKGKKVIVLTGRHGEQAGNPVGSDSVIDTGRVYDKEHVGQDQALKQKFFAGASNIEIMDLWLYNTTHTVENLKQIIQTHLQKGDVVVLAWCYSLFCLYSFSSSDAPVRGDKHVALTIANNDRPIKDIITDKFSSWVPNA